MQSEINVFIDKGEGHVKIVLPAEMMIYDAQGNEVMRPTTVEDIVGYYVTLVEAIKGSGHELGREAPRSFGGGGQKARPEDPPPAGVTVPEHDGQKCIFKPAFVNPKTSKQVSAKFVCRAGEACTGKVGQYPWSVWLDAWMREQNEGA